MVRAMVEPRHAFTTQEWLRAWLRTALVGTSLLVVIFAGYEVLERFYLRDRVPVDRLFVFHALRGAGAAVLIGSWAVWNIWRTRRSYEVAFARAYDELEAQMRERVVQAKQLEAQVRNQEKLAALGVLAAGIAHDIGNPLASMSSELELLECEKDLGRVRASVSELRGQVARIARTLRDMTEFARRRSDESGAARIEVAVEDALRMVRHDPRARRIRFTSEVEGGLPQLPIPEDQLVMVLVNLLINSFDAIGEVGLVSISARREGDRVQLCVHDDGAGMTEETRARALEPLFTTKRSGTGLGLSVSADAVRAVGGSVGIVSAPGQGTSVRLGFPAAPPAETVHA